MTKILICFIVFSALNVILTTLKNIAVVKWKKLSAGLMAGVDWFVYTYVLFFINIDGISTFEKACINGIVNIIGVYLVKLLEEKAEKTKTWMIICTFPTQYTEAIDSEMQKVPHDYTKLSDKHTKFTFYCETKHETNLVKDICSKLNGRYFIVESREECNRHILNSKNK